MQTKTDLSVHTWTRGVCYRTAEGTLGFGGRTRGVPGVRGVCDASLGPAAWQFKIKCLSVLKTPRFQTNTVSQDKSTSCVHREKKRMRTFRKHYLGQWEAGLWNGQSCSTVVSHVTAWTEEVKHKTMSKFLRTHSIQHSSEKRSANLLL